LGSEAKAKDSARQRNAQMNGKKLSVSPRSYRDRALEAMSKIAVDSVASAPELTASILKERYGAWKTRGLPR
jgi:hypothetical protein